MDGAGRLSSEQLEGHGAAGAGGVPAGGARAGAGAGAGAVPSMLVPAPGGGPAERWPGAWPGGSVPILAEQGREQVMADAAADSSSFVCSECRGVVSRKREKEHRQLWCAASMGGQAAGDMLE